MAVASQTIEDANKEGTLLEKYVNSHVGNFIHFFLTILAVMVMVAACIALLNIALHGFPQLWHARDEYQTLHQLLQNILLLAIAGELGLLLLFHRASAAVEVVMFVICPKIGGYGRHSLRSADGINRLIGPAGGAVLFPAGETEVKVAPFRQVPKRNEPGKIRGRARAYHVVRRAASTCS